MITTFSGFIRRIAVLAALVALGAGLVLGSVIAAPPSAAVRLHDTGTLRDGSAYRIDVPKNFNGTLLLYSHGLVVPGEPNPPSVAPDDRTGDALLERGYALAGSALGTGYAVEPALRNQVELLGVYAKVAGKPKRTIAWGSSMGGLISAELLERHPKLISGGLSTCGLLGGTVGLWDTYLDTMFVIKTLLAPQITLTGDRDPFKTVAAVSAALQQAKGTAQGRARIALAAAMMDLPGWFGAGSPRPPAGDLDAQVEAQLQHLLELDVILMVAARSELEQRAGGNPSTNERVDYARQLRRSVNRAQVEGLYRAAGVDLSTDLQLLAAAPRVTADQRARRYAYEFATFTGDLRGRPMVTLHTTGDGAVPAEHEQAYAAGVRRAGDSRLLRQLFVERAGHCTFTPAELIATVGVIDHRIRTGHFGAVSPGVMKAKTTALGPQLNGVEGDSGDFIPVDPGFTNYQPGPFLRPAPGR